MGNISRYGKLIKGNVMSKPIDNARKGKGSDRENRGTQGKPKKSSGEHRKSNQGGNAKKGW